MVTTQFATGMAVLVTASVMNASFTLPMKHTQRWAWENTWLVWSVLALIMLPIAVSAAAIPHFANVYKVVYTSTTIEVAVFGAGWGIAQVLFGLAVDAIGIALTFSLVLGTSAAIGTIIPFLHLHPERLLTPGGWGVLGGVALLLTGVLLCAIAGRQRDKAMQDRRNTKGDMKLGLSLAILCGMAASLMNLGVAFGAPLIQAAHGFGASDIYASNAIWLPLMLAGSLPNILYCLWLLKKNRSTRKFLTGSHISLPLAFVMAVFWYGSTLLYGFATLQLGVWGPILGWPLFMSLIVITASLLGIFTGEWKHSGVRPLRIQWAGVILLVIAVFILAASSRALS